MKTCSQNKPCTKMKPILKPIHNFKMKQTYKQISLRYRRQLHKQTPKRMV
ncbi:hypothetical protein Hanom_Chr06g00578051 [Helianthus anomalus]